MEAKLNFPPTFPKPQKSEDIKTPPSSPSAPIDSNKKRSSSIDRKPAQMIFLQKPQTFSVTKQSAVQSNIANPIQPKQYHHANINITRSSMPYLPTKSPNLQ